MEETRSPREATDAAAPDETRSPVSTPRTRLFRARRRRNVQIVPLPVTLAEIERFEKAGYLDPARRGDRADEAEGDLVTPIWRHVAALGLVPASPSTAASKLDGLGTAHKRNVTRYSLGTPMVCRASETFTRPGFGAGAPLAFHQRCWSWISARARRMARSAGMSGRTGLE